MAATYPTAAAPTIGFRAAALLAALRGRTDDARRAVARHRVQRETEAELDALPDRALADLGLSRGEIRAVARQAAADTVR